MVPPPGSKRIRLYIDESGDHRPAREGDGFAKRYLCLVGVMFPMDGPLHTALERLKSKHFPNHDREDPICLHRRDIIDARPPFASLRDPAKREAFNTELVGLLGEQAFVVIGIVIDKIQHENRKRKEVVLPYDFGLRLMLERYSGRLIHKGHTGDVMAESRGHREDGALRSEYERIYNGGTQYHSAQQFQRALTSKQLKLKGKEANIAGLQLADLLARDVLIDVLHRKGVSVPAPSAFSKQVIDVLQTKYNKNTSTGKIDGYGRVIV
jgi:hypothetical protein